MAAVDTPCTIPQELVDGIGVMYKGKQILLSLRSFFFRVDEPHTEGLLTIRL